MTGFENVYTMEKCILRDKHSSSTLGKHYNVQNGLNGRCLFVFCGFSEFIILLVRYYDMRCVAVLFVSAYAYFERRRSVMYALGVCLNAHLNIITETLKHIYTHSY